MGVDLIGCFPFGSPGDASSMMPQNAAKRKLSQSKICWDMAIGEKALSLFRGG
jgi:hypothetical protein